MTMFDVSCCKVRILRHPFLILKFKALVKNNEFNLKPCLNQIILDINERGSYPKVVSVRSRDFSTFVNKNLGLSGSSRDKPSRRCEKATKNLSLLFEVFPESWSEPSRWRRARSGHPSSEQVLQKVPEEQLGLPKQSRFRDLSVFYLFYSIALYLNSAFWTCSPLNSQRRTLRTSGFV